MTGSSQLEETLPGRGGVPLWVTRYAPASQPSATLVLIHGWGEHQGRYRELTESMAGQGFSVWRFDLRGHGRSGGRKGHVDRFADYVYDLVKIISRAETAEAPGQHLLLLGHSMGGLILLRALQTGAVSPVAACVSSPWLRTLVPIPAWKRALAASLRRFAPAFPIPSPLNSELLTTDAEKIREHANDPLVHGWMTPRCFSEIEEAQNRVLAEPTPLALPILFVVPGKDPVVDAETTTHFIGRGGGQGARVVDARDSRHEPLNEVDRNARFGEVGSFFAGVLDSPRHDMDEM